jgi:hypothetical protein
MSLLANREMTTSIEEKQKVEIDCWRLSKDESPDSDPLYNLGETLHNPPDRGQYSGGEGLFS